MDLLFLAAATYQAVAAAACFGHMRRRDPTPKTRPAVSILKPVYGADDHFWPAILSHAQIRYPQFEILFGVRDSRDTAVPMITELQRQFPGLSIQLIAVSTDVPNAKVGSLMDMAREAKSPVLVVNDSDILVPPYYLDTVVAPLEDERVGLVTCLYRASASSFPSKWEALGIATDFTPSALVAPRVGVNEFGLGSTLAFRRKDLESIGGFAALADSIADDYQLGKKISALGKKVYLTRMWVTTHMGAGTWKSVWEHQIRWARTIRLSRGGYLGLPITNASVWAFVALWIGWADVALALLILRIFVGLVGGLGVLRDPMTARYWWLMPARDLWGFGVWVVGAVGRRVVWRGRHLKLAKGGRILPDPR